MKNLSPFFLLLLVLVFNSCGSNASTETESTDVVKAQVGDQDVEAKLKELGITLPAVPPPVANYVNSVRTGDLVFMAGKGPNRPEGGYITGKLGQDLSVEEGYQAARLAAIIQLAALKAEIGDLNKVKRIVKVLGMVNAVPDFTDHPEVINGFSDLMVEVFGDKGKHARAAVGMGSLPRNIAVEIEMIVEVE
ncbi:MAG: RidA family protein [Saprospiraceae bacterium]|nr:RidA family protein [Saprospiraceae bacterium]